MNQPIVGLAVSALDRVPFATDNSEKKRIEFNNFGPMQKPFIVGITGGFSFR